MVICMDLVEQTGLAKEQIRQSLLNAAGAFNWDVDHKNINLIVLEADYKKDIDVCDALFGTEYGIFDKRGHSWSRKNDGFFREPDLLKRLLELSL